MSISLNMLDTNTVSYLIKQRDSRMQDRLNKIGMANVCISSITEAELRFGLAQRSGAQGLVDMVEDFLHHVDRLSWDSDAARCYAELRSHCTNNGIGLSNMDMLIASHAVAVNATLVTSDKAFVHISDKVTLDNWLA